MFENYIPSITTQQLKEKLNQNIQLIDVREEDEYNNGHISQAINILLSTIQQFNKDKAQTYYLICQSGRRSQQAAEFLQTLGYHAINISGGMNQWTGPITR